MGGLMGEKINHCQRLSSCSGYICIFVQRISEIHFMLVYHHLLQGRFLLARSVSNTLLPSSSPSCNISSSVRLVILNFWGSVVKSPFFRCDYVLVVTDSFFQIIYVPYQPEYKDSSFSKSSFLEKRGHLIFESLKINIVTYSGFA
jgi:hypothetical protein